LKIAFEKRELAIVAALLIIAFFVRLAFFSNQGYQIDTGDFMAWFQRAADLGPRVFYNDKYWCDYPPLNIYFFWIFGLIAKNLSLFGTSLFTYVMKLPANLFDMATAFLIFAFVRKRLTAKLAFVATALYAFNPAVIFNAAVWGQFDAIYTFFLVLSIFLVFESKPKWAVVAFMLGILTKPQSIAIAPLFIYFALRKLNWNWKGTLVSLFAAVATAFAVILPFEWSNPITFLSSKYFGAYGTYPYTTLNAFNIWGFGGMWVSDTNGFSFLTPYLLGWTMFAAVAAFTLYFVHKRYTFNEEGTVLFAALVLFFAFFMLPTRIHERYLFPAMAILALLFPFIKKARPLYIVLTATCFVNQAYVLNALVNAYPSGANLTGDPVVFIVSLINSVAFVYVLMLMSGDLTGKKWLIKKSNSSENQVTTKEEALPQRS
jgi:Gpi18-like mannosyltransferase